MPRVDIKFIVERLVRDPVDRASLLHALRHSDDPPEIYVDDLVSPHAAISFNRRDSRVRVYGEPSTVLELLSEAAPTPGQLRFGSLSDEAATAVRSALEVARDEPAEVWWAAERSWLSGPPKTAISLLRLDEAPILAETWEPGRDSPDSADYIRRCIALFPGLCVRNENGAPIAWVIRHLSGSMGIVYTVPDHRRKGYARDLTLDIAARILDAGDPAFAHIYEFNEPSKRLAASCGLRLKSRIRWITAVWSDKT